MKYFLLSLFGLIMLSSCQNTTEPPVSGSDTPRTPARQGAIGNPLDSLNALLANDPENPHLLANRALLHLSMNNINAGRNDVNIAYSIDSNIAIVREAKGELNYMLNMSQYARNEWEACIRIDPENVNCLMRLTELYIAVKNYDRALELSNQILKADPDNAQAYFMKGIIIRDKNQDTALALQYFQNAVDIKQDYIAALDILGVTLAQKGDTLAKYYYQRILDIQPNRGDIYYKLGAFYMNNGETNRALEAFTKATQLNPRDAEAYFSLAYIHIELRQFARARDLFTKSIQAKDRNYKAYYGRGYAFEMLGDVINAKEDYQKALEILPMYTPAREALDRINNIMAR